PAPTGADSPARSAVVSGGIGGVGGTEMSGGAVERADATEPVGSVRAGSAPVGSKCAESERAESEQVGSEQVGSERGEDLDEADHSAEDGPDDQGEEAERSRSWDLLLLVGICLAALLLVNAFVARPFSVPSGSMEDTLRPGDRLVANQLSYAFGGHPQRGDVVVFDGTGSFLPGSAKPTGFWDGLHSVARDLGLAPAGDTVYVKRVIGVGGDRVTSTGPGAPITVNGVPIDETSYLASGDDPSSVAFDVVVPAGELWVMGDHRSASRDSRDHLGEPGGGFVPEEKVIGRADWVVYPFSRWTGLDRPAAFAATAGTGGHGGQR
ncbi:signal peptidase I, partial [Kitasatospora sp. NPDC056783]|uniref:signal peptidase I n=1 Tax=Kitasatospora sp. NPDC056783 TaxID=3345943 RepID=UPI0036B79130